MQYDVLLYESPIITTIRKINKVVKRIVQLIFHRKKFESTKEEGVKQKIYLASDLNAYEVLKYKTKKRKGTMYYFANFKSFLNAKLPYKAGG